MTCAMEHNSYEGVGGKHSAACRLVIVSYALAVLVGLTGAAYFAVCIGGLMTHRGVSEITIKTNAALSLLLSGAGLLLLIPENPGRIRSWIGRICALIVLVLGGLTLVENITGRDFGIDQLLAQELPGALGVDHPNRTGVPASAGFLLTGLSLLLISRQGRCCCRVSQGLAIGTCLIGMLGVVGNLYDVRGLHALVQVTAVAWPTALALLGLGIGLLCARPGEGLMVQVTADDAGGAAIRRLLIPSILQPLVLGFLRVMGEREGIFNTAMGTALFSLLLMIIFTVLLYYNGRRISQAAASEQAASQALRDSERQFRGTFENAAVGIAHVDAQGRFIRVNQKLREMLGHEGEELRGRRFLELTYPDDQEPDRSRFEALMRGELDSYTLEKRYLSRDGRPVWGQVTRSLQRDEQGRPAFSISIVEDITGRKQAQESLRAAHERMETILGSISDAFFALDRNWRFVYVNAETERQLRKSAAELLGNCIWDLFPDAENFRRRYEQARASGQAVHFEEYYPPLEAWFEVHAYPSADGLSVYYRNVNDQKQAREALRQSREDLDRAQEVGQIGWWRLDTRKNVLTWSDESYRIFGVPKGTPLTYEDFVGIVHPDDRSLVDVRWNAGLAGEPYDIEHRIVVNGQTKWVREKAYLEFDEAGNLRGGFGIAQDITARKQAEEALKRLNEELEQRVRQRTAELEQAVAELKRSNEDLQQFAYVSSHDLQEPLRMVASYVGLLESRYKDRLDEHAREFIGYAVEGAKRMQGLIKDLLEYSRIQSRGKPFAPVDCERLLAAVENNLQVHIQETGAIITHDPLPTVTGDKTQLMQVFQNLIDNALKFRRPDQTPRVHISAQRRDHEWCFNVRDNGIGIDPQFHDRIFVIFQRLPTRRHYAGSGIGLAIVKRIVERHHGQVCVLSTPDEGSTFSFTLPVSAG